MATRNLKEPDRAEPSGRTGEMNPMNQALKVRKPSKPIIEILVQRWSPRAMSDEMISQSQLETMFEAARWAPSTYNEQEWRFLYAWRNTPVFAKFFDFLMEANQSWCKTASVLIVVLSHKVFERNGKANSVHSLDTGMAVQNLLLQTAAMGLVGHGMAGFDSNRAREVLRIPDDYQVECMIALGRPGDPEVLDEELRKREHPSDRNPITAFAFEGQLPGTT